MTATITVDPISAAAGASVSVTGSGFGRKLPVSVYLDGAKVASSSSNPRGSFGASFAVPNVAAGAHQVSAVSVAGTAVVSFTITAPTSPPPPTSPPTSTTDTDAFAASLGFATKNLTLSDEFDGTAGSKPDATRWAEKTYTDTSSKTYWEGSDLVTLDGASCLDIMARKDTNVVGEWDSAFLTGLHAYSGPRFVVARAKVPAGIGTFPAPIWEWPAPNGAGPGPELDICEQLGKEPQTYHATAHWWTSGGVDDPPQSSAPIATGVNLADAFYDYGAAVFADRIEWFFDQNLVRTVTAAQWSAVPQLVAGSVVTCIDFAMGGWGGAVDPALAGPLHLKVDYVRIYQP